MTQHERLVAKWNSCGYGIKTQIFNDDMPQRSVQYIISTPRYKDTKKIEWLIKCIDKHVENFKNKANKMVETIQSI